MIGEFREVEPARRLVFTWTCDPRIPGQESNNEPGPVAFADPARVQVILGKSHWTEIEILPVDVECSMPEKDLNRYLTNLGPFAAALQELEPQRAEQTFKRLYRCSPAIEWRAS